MKAIQYIKTTHYLNRAAFASGAILALLATVLCLPISSGEQETQAATGTAQESSITMNFASNTASVNLTVNNSNGTFATSSENSKASFSVITNNYTGYNLSILATDDDGELVNGEDSLESISGSLTASQFDVSANNGKWGYMPNKYQINNTIIDNTGSDAVYLVSPTTAATILDNTNIANPNTANEYTIALGARADYTKANGSYSKTFTLTAVGNPITYSVTYDKNTSDTVTNMPYPNNDNTQTADTSDTLITLSNLVPEREGYVFKGWCSVATSDDTCSGTTYNPDGGGTNLTYGIDQTTVNTATIYAMWDSAAQPVITINAGAGISTVALDGWTDSGTSSMNKTLSVNDTVDLSTMTSAHKTGYNGLEYVLSSGSGSISGDTFTVGSSDATITVKATGLDTPVCTMTGGAAKVYNRSATTLTATSNAESYDSDSVDITYSFGYGTSGTAALGHFGAAQADNTITIAKNAFRGGRYYGVKVVVTDKNDSTITSTCTSGTGYGTGDTVAARAGLGLWNSRIVFDATTNGGTLSGTSPLYVAYGESVSKLYTGRTNSTLASLPTAIPPTGYIFTGWYTSGGTKVLNADGTATGTAVSGWVSAKGNWTKTGTSNTSTGASYVLYAHYVAVIPMQSMTLEQCTVDGVNVLDSRDKEIYLAKRLADGKCWMLDNLRLDLVAHKNNLNQTNTNATNEQLAYLKGTSTGTSSDKWAMSGVSYWTSSSYSYSAPWIAIKNASDESWNPDTTTTSYGDGSGKIGVYYNYCAASAGTYCWGNGTVVTGSPSSDPNTNSGYDIDGDICPAGWRMPTGGAIATGTIPQGEYQSLANAITGGTSTSLSGDNATAFKTALSTPLSGTFYSGSAHNQGSGGSGDFWSSTYGSNSYMHALYVYSSNVVPQPYSSRGNGYSVRCVLDTPYLQDQTDSTLAAAMPNVGDTKTYYDKRDSESYLIGHLADGNYWMLDNLRLDLTDSTVLANTTAENTNASTTTLNYLKNGGGSTSDQYATAAVSNWTSSISYSAPLVNMASKDVVPTDAPTGGSGSNKVGGYYNFCAASAGYYCYGNGTSTGTPLGNAKEDICPKGWRMPTGGSSGEYQALYSAYSRNATNFLNALSTPLSGYFYDGSASSQGTDGIFWSSVRNGASGVYLLRVGSSSVDPQYYKNRYYGYSVRCLFHIDWAW